jgi:subtilisin family serine protease
LATPVTRQKPDIVGPDGGNDTFLGFTLASANITGANGQLDTTNASCQNNASYPNFFGTSAATPHVAAIAALLLQADAALTPTQIYTALTQSAVPATAMVGTTTTSSADFVGAGFVQADTAATLIPAVAPVAPTLSLSSMSVPVGTAVTITWKSANTTGCTASGSWSGALASSGSQTVTPTAAGTATYALTCANAAGSSPATSVALQVTSTASGSSHGGGEVSVTTLLGLGALRLLRRRLQTGSQVPVVGGSQRT